MIAVPKPTSYHLGPAQLLLGGILAAVNWYVQPERALAYR